MKCANFVRLLVDWYCIEKKQKKSLFFGKSVKSVKSKTGKYFKTQEENTFEGSELKQSRIRGPGNN